MITLQRNAISSSKFTQAICLSSLLLLNVCHSVHAQQAWAWKSNEGKDVSILLFGDTNIQNRKNPADAFRHVLPTLHAADLRICNLEGPFAGTSQDPRIPDIPHKSQWKHSEPEMVKGLVAARIDAVGVANNVTYPWMALLKSLKVLDEQGIKHAGGGENLDEAHKAAILEKNGVKVGLLSYACTVFPFQHAATAEIPGIATVRIKTFYTPAPNLDKPGTPMLTVTIPLPEELARMRKDIRELKKEVDVVIVSYHWGISDHDPLFEYQVTIAHEAIDAGADVIMGHGNHRVEAVEMFNGKPIFYGLGNFAFDWEKMRDRNMEGLAVKIDIKDGKLDRVSFVPMMRNEQNDPVFLDPNSAYGSSIVNNVSVLSRDLSTLRIEGKEVFVEKPMPSAKNENMAD